MNKFNKQKLSSLYRYYKESKILINVSLEKMGMSITGREIKPSETIIIAGSGRSGTSWIQNTLAELIMYQPVFEPLNPNFVYEAKQLLGVEQASKPIITSPYLRSDGEYPEWNALLRQALTGNVRNYWTDKKRFSLSPKGYITKFIRANFMLGYISNNFNPKIIFVMRHPCAVIFSRMRLNWEVNLQYLLSDPDIVEDYLQPYLLDIKKETDPVGIHAIWWALEQLIALDSLNGRDYFFVHYEDVYLSNYQKFSEIINWLGLKDQQDKLIKQQEKSLEDDSEYTFRISQWESGLNSDQKEKILWWANRFGIDYYTDQIVPRKSS
jgi:hypothetical protein